MKVKAYFLILLILTVLMFQSPSIKALTLNDRVENAINWILTRKTTNPEVF